MASPEHVKYTGPSMNPTLKAGDILNVIHYGGRQIRVGDIVVFHTPGEQCHVVHRVVSLDLQGGVRTRGDNNPNIDPYTLTPERIIGRVVSAQRGTINIPFHGGRRGRFYANIMWAAKWINLAISRALHPVYHWLVRKDIFRKVVSPFVKPRLLYFKRTNGLEMQLLVGRWVIGRRLPGQDRWRINRPFRLLIDEAYLPDETTVP